ncbi:MAG TPA: spermidine/putrescine ABC transporter ATP-binding protein [Clostridiales bacterium]|nr:ABC transporter ATP-binding protein [Clostridiales bacterium]HBL81250.1 spermidine/putrescine ABC transporter ATP-binding protein [Clostridiales bacterium]
MSNAIIKLENISKSFGEEDILENFSVEIARHEFVTILGPSGCGKTTTLRLIGGFELPDSGRILFDGEDITSLPPYKRRLNTVFQKYALFPHMNVFDNVAFGLSIKKVDKKIIKEKVSDVLKLVNLKGFENRNISSLSGGQQQRIAIARALVNEPEVLLLDEPLGALDLKLRQEMQLELKKIQTKLGITFIYVTHDQEEALTMSDEIIVMNDGQIQQKGTPVDIYNEPKNAFVAGFIGESNIIDGNMKKDLLVQFAGQDFVCLDSGFDENELVDVVIRPEDIKFDKENGRIKGTVQSVVFKGVHYEMHIRAENFDWIVHSTAMEPEGSTVFLDLYPNDIHIMRKVAEE